MKSVYRIIYGFNVKDMLDNENLRIDVDTLPEQYLYPRNRGDYIKSKVFGIEMKAPEGYVEEKRLELCEEKLGELLTEFMFVKVGTSLDGDIITPSFHTIWDYEEE
jgi:hypothetical protein